MASILQYEQFNSLFGYKVVAKARKFSGNETGTKKEVRAVMNIVTGCRGGTVIAFGNPRLPIATSLLAFGVTTYC